MLKKVFSPVKDNEKGSVLIISILVLILLTIIGIAATNTTTTDILISGNYKLHDLAFYAADSGINTTPKIISAAIDDDATPLEFAAINFGSSNSEQQSFYREIMGFAPHDSSADLSFHLGAQTISVDVNRRGSRHLPGGGAEFASGAEGVGVGSAGGVAVFYDLDSTGKGPSGSQSEVIAEYKKVVGVGG